jgi:adenylate cyclase
MCQQSVKNIARPVRTYAMSSATVASTPLVSAPTPLGPARSLQRLIIPASAIAALCVAVLAWWAWPKGSPSPASVQTPAAIPPAQTAAANIPAPRLSFVVLPFENLSKDPDQEYFADGITDDLTTDLSRISGSFVIARTTAFSYKGKAVDVKLIGRELGVGYIIEGSVRRADAQVQVNVQLIDAETGAHLWADRFETDRAGLAKAQDEITGRLAKTLNVQLIQAASDRIECERAADPGARDLWMRSAARFQRGPLSSVTVQEALLLDERALEKDPGSIDAKIGIAAMMDAKLANGCSSSVEQDQERAERLLLEILDREPNNGQAHKMKGILRRFQGRLSEARAELETAIALDPNDTFSL